MAEESFPLPGSSYKQLERIIDAYAETTDKTGPGDVAQLAGTDVTTVSRNNKFLVAIGIIQGGQKKSVTELGKKIARSIRFGMEDELSSSWAEIVRMSEFLQKIVSAVRIRRGMDTPALINHIAFTAGAAKHAATMAGAGAVVEILTKAGLLKDNSGTLVATESTLEPTPDTASTASVTTFKSKLLRPVFYGGNGPLFADDSQAKQSESKSEGITIAVNLNIDCSPSDLSTLGEKLKAFLAGLNAQSPVSDSSSGDQIANDEPVGE